MLWTKESGPGTVTFTTANYQDANGRFSAGGKSVAKKDLGATGRDYGNVYVAQIAMGANDLQATKALLEADAWPGPSLVIAYSTCIAHGIDMRKGLDQAVNAMNRVDQLTQNNTVSAEQAASVAQNERQHRPFKPNWVPSSLMRFSISARPL